MIRMNFMELTNSMEHSPSQKANSCSPGQEFPLPFMESEKFITVFTIANHWTLV